MPTISGCLQKRANKKVSINEEVIAHYIGLSTKVNNLVNLFSIFIVIAHYIGLSTVLMNNREDNKTEFVIAHYIGLSTMTLGEDYRKVLSYCPLYRAVYMLLLGGSL